jgi:hypothetical protein
MKVMNKIKDKLDTPEERREAVKLGISLTGVIKAIVRFFKK